MRVLICGSRDWNDPAPIAWIIRAFKHGPDECVVIEGEAKGADLLARRSAERQNVEVESYPADWQRDGKAAGPIRNQRMLDDGKPDVVFAFKSKPLSTGTDDMIRRAQKAGLPTYVVYRAVPVGPEGTAP